METYSGGNAADMYSAESGLPPLSPPVQPHSSYISSPVKRSTTVNTGAVIRSPMTMTSPHVYANTAAAASSTSSPGVGRVSESASPLSVTTAAEYAEIEQKQVELRSVVEHRIMTLERSLQRREEEIETLRMQLRKIEEDYQFNYELIKDRDAALEEAATQLQSLYEELRHRKSEESTVARRLEGLEQETHQLRQRLREAETQREETLQRAQQVYQLKEKQLREGIDRKETTLDAEKQRLHEEYLQRFKALDDIQAETSEKNELLIVELEKKWSQQVKSLEEKLIASTKAMDAVQREKAVSDSRYAEVSQALSLLKCEHESLQKQHQVAVEEAAEKQRSFETRMNEYSALMGQGIATAEDGIRQQTQRATKLEVECGQLQSQVTELHERLQMALIQRDEDTKRFMEERLVIKESYRQAEAKMEEQRRAWAETERQLNLQLQRLQDDLDDAQRQGTTALSRVGELQTRHEDHEKERVLYEQEIERLRRDLLRCREEEQRTAAHAQESNRAADAKVRVASREVEESREEMERLKKRLFEEQERAQSESARLTRELHASEAARRALEEHFHLAEDSNTQRALVEGLRREKEELGRKVLELEHTNAAIRDQVAAFTMELQNDPVMKSAKETQRRVQELQEELLRAREHNQKLRDTLQEKEDEVSRYQLEILRARSTETEVLHQRDQEDQRLREEYRTAKEAYERMRRALMEQQQQQQQRRRSSPFKETTKDGRDEDTDDGDAKENQSRDVKKKIHNKIVERDAVLMREAELWRRKYLQLEQHVRDLLRERDGLAKELQLTRQDVDALVSEKQSLVDLNSLLKAQLREAYRTALEYPQLTAPPSSLPPAQREEHTTSTPPREADGPFAAGRAEMRGSSQSVPSLAVDAVLNSTAAPHSSADADRLAALEGELAAMKAHMMAQRQGIAARASRSTVGGGGATSAVAASFSGREGDSRRPPKQKQQGQAPQNAPLNRTQSRSRAAVVHRGHSAVRHYGYL